MKLVSNQPQHIVIDGGNFAKSKSGNFSATSSDRPIEWFHIPKEMAKQFGWESTKPETVTFPVFAKAYLVEYTPFDEKDQPVKDPENPEKDLVVERIQVVKLYKTKAEMLASAEENGDINTEMKIAKAKSSARMIKSAELPTQLTDKLLAELQIAL